jgi:hypothetical protein
VSLAKPLDVDVAAVGLDGELVARGVQVGGKADALRRGNVCLVTADEMFGL